MPKPNTDCTGTARLLSLPHLPKSNPRRGAGPFPHRRRRRSVSPRPRRSIPGASFSARPPLGAPLTRLDSRRGRLLRRRCSPLLGGCSAIGCCWCQGLGFWLHQTEVEGALVGARMGMVPNGLLPNESAGVTWRLSAGRLWRAARRS